MNNLTFLPEHSMFRKSNTENQQYLCKKAKVN